MSVVTATWKNGHIVPDGTVDWPEGCRLVIESAEDLPMSPEETVKRLALMDAIEPYLPTEQEFAGWEAALREQKKFELSRAEDRGRKVEGLFQ